jgi:hypothetical protein
MKITTVVIDETGNATIKVTGCRCREEAAIAAEFKKCFAMARVFRSVDGTKPVHKPPASEVNRDLFMAVCKNTPGIPP